ncbi:ubiquitin C-terminal hydrolase-like protein [Bimuria novae-zelandiae CBS 107.79]|uniref:ubiquitinyl hydrolase 1 n=1 Tax=Bimuria novae-zelandiae CBS 107.79 TaxID=1447943 RepID=A0A6A5UYY0_9PLEO|nr:ubiquitin C-terminal hydrolase-like protein [Bimuria novae-zelandiae CBS 107.79]
MDGPGKTAPLLLHDLLTYDPRYEDAAKRNLLTTPPPQYDPRSPPKAAVPYRNCRHDLQLKQEQSALPQKGTGPDHNLVYRVAAFCKKCRWHFDFWVDLRDNGAQNSPCRKVNHEFPLHHFIFRGEQDHQRSESLGGHNKPRTYSFSCSAPKCPVDLRIRISPPCFTESDKVLLTNDANLRKRWERSKALIGDRADPEMAKPIDAPNYLNTYLHDSCKPQKGKTRIPFLNRKFIKTFGEDCDDILKKLGFTLAVEQEQDGTTTNGWRLPEPSEEQDPLESLEPTSRTMVQDARYELNAIIMEFPASEPPTTRRYPLDLIPARSYLELALGCDDYELRTGGRRETRSTSISEEDHPYYAGLGALADFSDSLLLFAYKRQVDVDPPNTPYYFECLKDLAKGRDSDALSTECAILASQDLVTRQEINQAYRTLAIDPSHVALLSDVIITEQYKARLSDIGPAQLEEAKNALRVIGIARDSDLIKRTASSTIETYQEALAWLNLPDSAVASDDMVTSMFTSKLIDHPTEEPTARKAVQIIADHRKSSALWQWLETGDLGKIEMDAAEAYATLNIPDRSTRLVPEMLEEQVELMISDTPTNEERLRIALKIVKKDQETSYGNGAAPNGDSSHPPGSWPVGCRNIGNTCYLNSVLQFLFTIKPLREMVIECEKHFQDLSTEALQSKRVGRTAVSRARAETGQQFVRELRGLFNQMITATGYNVQPERSLAALALIRGENAPVAAASSTKSDAEHVGLGKIGDMPVSGPMLPPGFQSNSRPPTPADSVMGDADGDADSMKAMDLTATADEPNGTADGQPEQPSRLPPPVPPRRQANADIGLKELEETAQQQDAAEILNNVFDLLSCAFKGEEVLRDGEQLDMIKRTFFSDVTTVRRVEDKDIPKVDLQDCVSVSTNDRDRSLYAALDEEFGLTEIDTGSEKYEYFEKTAPIQIINVRRLRYENRQPRKDESHITLDKVLYMDRYLKKTDSLSEAELYELRKQQWRLQKNKQDLLKRRTLLKETEFKDVSLPDVLDETACVVKNLKDLQPEIDNGSPASPSEQGDNGPVTREVVSEHLSQRADELRPEVAEIEERIAKLEQQIDFVFADCKDHPYRLHAIFMHAGSHVGGHYWIYIYDFQKNIWRKYNDETVTEETEENIFKKLQQARPPTSTGIVYVRDDVATKFTEALYRNPIDQQGDVEMTDAPDVVNMDDITSMEVLQGQEVPLQGQEQ